jgi:hypothetical protein
LKLKLTPLNIITAFCLVAAVLLLFNKTEVVSPISGAFTGLWIGICLLAAVISFVSDIIFRKFIPLLKNLWIMECAFVVFTLVFVLIIKSSLIK